MKQEKLPQVLQMAAEIPALRDKLLTNRKETVARLDLSDAEKAVLLSASDEQLKKMIDATRKFWKRPIGKATKAAIALGVVALAVGPLFLSAGESLHVPYKEKAVYGLQQIVAIEKLYRDTYGVYGSMDNLIKDEKTKEAANDALSHSIPYKLIVASDGKTFSATAEHGTRSKTRPSFRVGPDGKIEELKP
jgi:hypothetical protein